MQGLSEGTSITLAIEDSAVRIDLGCLRQPESDGVGLVRDGDSRMPDLVERVVYNSTSGVS